MDTVSWAQAVTPLVAAAAVVVVVRWAVVDRRRADERAKEDRWEAHRKAEEDRKQATKANARRHDMDLILRVAVAFERHQAGDALAAAECRALLLAIQTLLPVTRYMYLGGVGWQPTDGEKIEAISVHYGLPVGPDLARIELRLVLQGAQFTINGRDGGVDTPEIPAAWLSPDPRRRQMVFRLKRAPKHART